MPLASYDVSLCACLHVYSRSVPVGKMHAFSFSCRTGFRTPWKPPKDPGSSDSQDWALLTRNTQEHESSVARVPPAEPISHARRVLFDEASVLVETAVHTRGDANTAKSNDESDFK